MAVISHLANKQIKYILGWILSIVYCEKMVMFGRAKLHLGVNF